MNKIFEGVCTALVTPFDKHGKIDFAALKKLIDFQIDGGIDALLVLGTTGEASTLTLDEKKQIVEAAAKQLKKKIPLVVGIGGNNPSAIIEFGKWLKKTHKVDGVLLSAPYYNKTTQSGLVAFFANIAKEIKLPIIAYNVPSRIGMNIEPSTFASLAKIKHLAGIKEASGSIQQIAEVIRACPNTAVYAGDDSVSLPAYALGAKGVISVASNIAPSVVGDIYRKSIDEARSVFSNSLSMFKTLFCEVNPIPVKYALSCMGLIENELRLPLVPLDKKYRDSVKMLIAK